MSGNIIKLNQELIHTELKDLVKNSVEETLNAMLDAEADRLVNAERYARDEERKGYQKKYLFHKVVAFDFTEKRMCHRTHPLGN